MKSAFVATALCAYLSAAAHAGTDTASITDISQAIWTSSMTSNTNIALSTDSSGKTMTKDTDHTFTAVYTLDYEAIKNVFVGTSNVIVASLDMDGNSADWTLLATPNGLIMRNEAFGSNITASDKWTANTATNVQVISSTVNVSTGLDNANWSSASYAAVTIANTAQGTDIVFTLCDATGAAVESYGGLASAFKASGTYVPSSLSVNTDLVTSAYVFDNTGQSSLSDHVALNVAAVSASIPEPATATLSLLALAGLAARRRRR